MRFVVVALLLAGCATALRHPDTGHRVECTSGFASTANPVALVVLNTIGAIPYAHCISKAKRNGYVVVDPPPAEPGMVHEPAR